MRDGSSVTAHVEVNGLRLAYQVAGSGPPVVLLHGGVSDHREWRRQVVDLAADHTVVAWDAPGCGESADPPEDTFRLPDYADCLAGLVQALGLGDVHLVGLSFGSGLALEVYRRHPHLVRSLVLVAAYAGWAGSLPPTVVAERLQQALRESGLPPDEFVPGWLPGLITDRAAPELAEELRSIMSEFHPVGYRVMARSFAEADLRPVLPTIDVPTLLVYGDADRRSSSEVAHAMHRSIPGSRLVMVPGAPHMVNMEAPEAFSAVVRPFLSEVEQQRVGSG